MTAPGEDAIVDTLEQDLQRALAAAGEAADAAQLEQLRTAFLGRRGVFAQYMKELAALEPAARPARGARLNAAREAVAAAFAQRHAQLQRLQLEAQLQGERADVTLPGRRSAAGGLHPVTRTISRVSELLGGMGFEVTDGPEIEDDYHNFDALNIPPDHPARAAHDTFALEGGGLLRSQTSSVQIRVMERQSPPLRIISPGRVYRNDYDQTHTPMFHQVEGLLVEEHSSFAELKGILYAFLRSFFEDEALDIRFRPSYFPFTVPSAEADIRRGGGEWLEVLGCGMVHPAVLRRVGIDPERFCGFAFGMGVERLAMLRYGVGDLRAFFENDLRFLRQFA